MKTEQNTIIVFPKIGAAWMMIVRTRIFCIGGWRRKSKVGTAAVSSGSPALSSSVLELSYTTLALEA